MVKTKERRHTNDIQKQLTLSLNANNIGETGATSLSESLKSNSTLTLLDLISKHKERHTEDIDQ